ncbi:hypothetical protein [Paraburkholderia tagetis]|uniref:Uncharacterized protein n=1 Tax=Paraburkholderia tagetis TaxID=2913261 RepID=A0A9X1RPQ6_9BURK|nr:hypothetical protein [Paraburkholderia tagetis]MCG5073023.1 hypothetical protein [Paraburkholderia tagetis]
MNIDRAEQSFFRPSALIYSRKKLWSTFGAMFGLRTDARRSWTRFFPQSRLFIEEKNSPRVAVYCRRSAFL